MTTQGQKNHPADTLGLDLLVLHISDAWFACVYAGAATCGVRTPPGGA
jgi:hypothetical protein